MTPTTRGSRIRWRSEVTVNSMGRGTVYTATRAGVDLAVVIRTGTPEEEFPWDWYLVDTASVRAGRGSGVADSRRHAKDHAEAAIDRADNVTRLVTS